MRILIVDDSRDCRDIAKTMLLAAGYNDVTTCSSAEEAYDVLAIGSGEAGTPPDLMLLDVMMPGTNGIEACAHIRKDTRYTDLPILMVTAMRDVDSLASAFIAGANDYIMKPFNRTEIIARVRSALKLKNELDRRRQRERELLQFMSTWVDRRGSQWIDGPTGLFIGEMAEAYLVAASGFAPEQDVSAIALAIDGIEARRAEDEPAARKILAGAAQIVRRTSATIGVVAAAYRNGVIVVVAPGVSGAEAIAMSETLRTSVSELHSAEAEFGGRNQLVARVSVVTGKAASWTDGVNLLTRAMAELANAVTLEGKRSLLVHA